MSEAERHATMTREIEEEARSYASGRAKFALDFASLAITHSESVEFEIRRAFLDGMRRGLAMAALSIAEHAEKRPDP